MNITTAKEHLLVKHFYMVEERDGWHDPDQDLLEEINKDIAKVSKLIKALDETQEFLDKG